MYAIIRRWRKLWRSPFLSFPEHQELEFQRRYNEASAPIASIGIAIGAFLMLAFYFWDLVIAYEQSSQTLLVRLGMAAWMIGIVCLPKAVRVRYFHDLFTTTIGLAGMAVVLIISLIPNGLVVGLSGVMLVLMFNFGFLRLLFLPSIASGMATCLTYNIAALIKGLDPWLLIANNFFLVSAMIAGTSITYLLERLFRDQFLAEKEVAKEREALARQNQNDARYLSWLRQLAQFLRHEVRHPVAQLNSSIEIAQLTCKDDRCVASHLASAALSSQHVWNLIERASCATDAEAFVRQFHPQWTDLRNLLAEQVEAFRQSNSGVTYVLRGETIASVYLDSTLIKEAVGNLLSNATSFANEGSAIEVELSTSEAFAYIAIVNRGPPITGDTEALFGPFTSTRSSLSDEHQGLGLFLVRLIAEQHGGTITITNLKDDEGVKATLALPMPPNLRISSGSRERARI
jgi:signal transduction histidine kinase